MFTTRRVVVIEADRRTAEMLHTFFRLMELDCVLIAPVFDLADTIRRHDPDVLILDLDLPDLHALEVTRELRLHDRRLPIIYLTDGDLLPLPDPVLRKPHGRFEELLRLFELVLETE